MGELTDLEVDRVDGMDRPATRLKFLITKAEGEGDPVAEAKRLIAASIKALGGVRKDAAAATLGDETVDALNELREALGEDGGEAFAKAAAPTIPATPDPAAAAAAAATATPVAPAAPAAPAAVELSDAAVEKIATAIAKGIVDAVNAADEVPAAPTRPASAQASGQDAIRKAAPKLGDGLFSNILS